MPNWKAIADQIAQGMFGEEAQQFQAKKQSMKLDEERIGLARNADARAAAGEGREAEASEYGKTRRKTKEEADNLSLDAARFEAGRRPIKAQHEDEDQDFQRTESERGGKRLELAMKEMGLRLALAQQAAADRKISKDRSAEDQMFQRANLQTQFDQANNPMNQKMAEIKQLQKIVQESGDEEEVATAQAQLEAAMADIEKERVLRGTKRQIVAGSK